MLDPFRKRDIPRTPPRPAGLVPLTPQAKPEQSRDRLLDAAPERTSAVTDELIPPLTPAALKSEPLPAQEVRAAEGRARLTVGAEIKLKGAQISDCDTLVVEGQVDACMDSRVIIVADHGVFRGKVHVDIAEIRGRFEGELTARTQLVIRASGCVVGKIRYGKISVDEGGELAGDIAAVGAPSTAEASTRAAAPTPLHHAAE